MRKNPVIEPPIAALKTAIRNFRNALQALQTDFPELKGKEKILENRIFGKGDTCFWDCITAYKSVRPLTGVELAKGFYRHECRPGEEKKTDAGDLKGSLDKICESINDFCEEGFARDEILGKIHLLYLEKIREITGTNLVWPIKWIDPGKPDKKKKAGEKAPPAMTALTVLRQIIRDHRDEMVASVVQKGSRPPRLDIPVAYLVAVLKTVFPDQEVSTGDRSLCYNLILAVLRSCAPDDKLPNQDKIDKTLVSRIKTQKKKTPLFQWVESSARVEPLNELIEIVHRAGQGDVNCLDGVNNHAD